MKMLKIKIRETIKKLRYIKIRLDWEHILVLVGFFVSFWGGVGGCLCLVLFFL